MAKAAKKKTTKKKTTRNKGAEPGSRGLAAKAIAKGEPPHDVIELLEAIEADGGTVIGQYREPLGGNWTVMAGLPIELVEPTPFQRDLSATHVKRLTEVLDRLDRYLDPVITVRNDEGKYWTPNGNHRLHALKNLGAKSIMALVVPETKVAYKILALNTEKAHNLKEKSLEVIRMARSLSELGDENESTYALEFEEPSLITLGACYEQRARFSGSAYNPILKRVEAFFDEPLSQAIATRESRAAALLKMDDAVAAAVKALKEKGFDSPYLKAFVVARINPIRARGATGEFDDVIGRMTAAAEKFDAAQGQRQPARGDRRATGVITGRAAPRA